MHFDVAVMGSINLDRLVYLDHFPRCGDNVVTRGSRTVLGGKGANQAIALASQGVRPALIGAVGRDESAAAVLRLLEEGGVDTRHIARCEAETGACVAIIDGRGENTCLGILGANMTFSAVQTEAAFADVEAPILLLQLETSRPSVEAALKLARRRGMRIILDPAPESLFFSEALSYADLVMPNRMEARAITGIEPQDEASARKVAERIAARGPADVIVKLGGRGSLLYRSRQDKFIWIEATSVAAQATIGAGDVFAGVLTAWLSRGEDLETAARAASRAAAIRVAGGALPGREELRTLCGCSFAADGL